MSYLPIALARKHVFREFLRAFLDMFLFVCIQKYSQATRAELNTIMFYTDNMLPTHEATHKNDAKL